MTDATHKRTRAKKILSWTIAVIVMLGLVAAYIPYLFPLR